MNKKFSYDGCGQVCLALSACSSTQDTAGPDVSKAQKR
jgi:hypothetical protein